MAGWLFAGAAKSLERKGDDDNLHFVQEGPYDETDLRALPSDFGSKLCQQGLKIHFSDKQPKLFTDVCLTAEQQMPEMARDGRLSVDIWLGERQSELESGLAQAIFLDKLRRRYNASGVRVDILRAYNKPSEDQASVVRGFRFTFATVECARIMQELDGMTQEGALEDEVFELRDRKTRHDAAASLEKHDQ